MNKIANQFTSNWQVTERYLGNRNIDSRNIDRTIAQKPGFSFEEILHQKCDVAEESLELRFSKHAAMRLEDRNINLSKEQSNRLENGVQKASEKGIKESLVLMDSLAFIVNVPNKIVVTAMDQAESSENIFTNIDGAVIV